VKTFTEKPQKDLAEEFLASGDFYWNSGIFIWSLQNITAAFEKHLPEMQDLFQENAAAFATPAEKPAIKSIYGDCENISIDYGIMEKASNVTVVLSDFGWSDLGTWGSLHEKLPLDAHGNGTTGTELWAHEAAGNVVVTEAEESKKIRRFAWRERLHRCGHKGCIVDLSEVRRTVDQAAGYGNEDAEDALVQLEQLIA
jgi:mannose-1-phosphate guanylyltransferase